MKRALWIALVALALIPYLGAIHAPLLYDDRTLLDNRWLAREAGPISVFGHDYWHGTKHAGSDLYRPLTVLSLAWNVRAAPSKEGFRAVNLALHALATIAVAWMLCTISSFRPAWIGAALFAVHPLASEAVLWAVGRAEILSATCGIAAFVLFVRLDGDRGLGGSRLALSLAAFFGALCFKESAAAWLAIGAAWILLGRRDSRAPAGVAAARGACYGAALAAFLVLRGSVVGWAIPAPSFVDNPLVEADAPTRAVNAVLLFGRYLLDMLWPKTLSIEFGFDQIPVVPMAPWGALAALVIAGVAIASVATLRRRGHPAAAFLLAFPPCAFALTGNLAFPIGTIFAERLAYLPLAGLCGLAGVGLAAIPRRSWRFGVCGVLIAACAARSFARGGDYRDLATLSEATVAASPRAVKALVNAGRTRLRQGHAARAVPLLERAVEIWPDYRRAWELLADAYAAEGNEARAGEARRRANESHARAIMGDEPL